MRFINLTPHDVHLYDEAGEKIVATYSAPPKGEEARVEQEERLEQTFSDDENNISVPILAIQFGGISRLPDAQPGIGYIVSSLTGQAAQNQGRIDIFLPARIVRDDKGRVIGCKALSVP